MSFPARPVVRLSLLAGAILRASVGGAQVPAPASGVDTAGVSPRISRLARDVASQGPAAVNAFWSDVTQTGTPLIEPIAGDSSRALVTFLWRGAQGTKAVLVSLQFTRGQLQHLGTTDVWYRTFTIRSDYRLAYAFAPTTSDPGAPGAPQPDPLSRRVPVAMLGPNPMSVVDLPRARPVPWVARNPSVPAGRLEEREIESAILENEPRRRITIYTPSGYDARRAPVGLVIFMDHSDYLGSIGAPTILDNLIAEKRVPPLIGVFIHHNSAAAASADLDNHQIFADFLSKELVPWLRRGWSVTAEASGVILCGASRGGLGAAYAAYRHPDLFGNVLSESGALWRGNEGANEPHEWLTQQMRNGATLPIRFYMTVGTFETGLTPGDAGRGEPTFIDANRHFRDVLRAKGYSLEYHETPGGHDPLHWRSELPYGLMFLTAR